MLDCFFKMQEFPYISLRLFSDSSESLCEKMKTICLPRLLERSGNPAVGALYKIKKLCALCVLCGERESTHRLNML